MISRRAALRLGAVGLAMPLMGCGDGGWYGTDVSGLLPDLSFRMTRASDGKVVTQGDYVGQVVALFFGYTFCPDICPMTLSNLAAVAERLGTDAENLSILFVTVDPERDTPDVMARYTAAFTSRASGLRGTDNQLARLARRFKVTYKVAPHAPRDVDYAVSHGKSVYVFDAQAQARVMWPSFDTLEADIGGAVGDVRRVMVEG
ncbi:SCO family protein [Roseovarius tibetensis]|uniref:SCO family protein n=1 Tax=Roseovarius tibetensis TaxID=2685897 RepID=UPI003D7F2026